jgi:hypothetical protein
MDLGKAIDPDSVHSKNAALRCTMRNQMFRCRERSQAIGIVRLAMDLGVPIDYVRKLDHSYWTFVSRLSLDDLKTKHKWKDPTIKRARRTTIRRYTRKVTTKAQWVELLTRSN